MKVVIGNMETEQKPDVMYDAYGRKGVRKQPMKLEEAYRLLKEAFDEYTLAKHMAKSSKKGHLKFVREKEQEADSMANRVRNIIEECPQLDEYTEDKFIYTSNFESYFKDLMRELDKMIGKNKQE